MMQQELAKLTKHFSIHGLYKNISVLWGLTLMLPNCFGLFFIHLKLELLTQFPAPNDEK